MKSIGSRWKGPPWDYAATCDYCGTRWPRSKMYRDGAGLLVCPTEGDGLDAVTLNRDNARMARRDTHRRLRNKHDGGNFDKFDPNEEAVHITDGSGFK